MCVYKHLPINTESIILSYLNVYDIIHLQRCARYDDESHHILLEYKHTACIEKCLDCIERIVLETNIYYVSLDQLKTYIHNLILYMYNETYIICTTHKH